MKLYIILFTVLINALSYAQSFVSEETKLREANKRKLSSIKSCSVIEYNYEFGQRKEVGKRIEFYEYNHQGFIVLKKEFSNNIITEYSANEYDTLNHIITYSEYDSFNNLLYKRTNKYDNNQLHFESINYDYNGDIISKQYFEYDLKKRWVGGKTINASGELDTKWIFKYANNLLVEELFYNSVGSIKSKTVYVYLNKMKVKETKYKADGAKQEEIVFEYPSKSRMITTRYIYYFAEPMIIKLISLFDRNGNLIEEWSEGKDKTINWREKYVYDLKIGRAHV